MKFILCSIYNKDTKEWSFPIPYKTRKTAVADFYARIAERSKDKHFDPSDWQLFCVGDFSIDSGNVNSCSKIQFADGVEDDDDDDEDDE